MNERFFKGEEDDEGGGWIGAAKLQPADKLLPLECARHFLSPPTTSHAGEGPGQCLHSSLKVLKFSLGQPLHSGFLPFQLNVPWKAYRCVG